MAQAVESSSRLFDPGKHAGKKKNAMLRSRAFKTLGDRQSEREEKGVKIINLAGDKSGKRGVFVNKRKTAEQKRQQDDKILTENIGSVFSTNEIEIDEA